jgi:hypothetical protein
MGVQSWFKSQKLTLQGAVITGAFAVTAAIISGIFLLGTAFVSGPRTTPPSACSKKLQITAPQDGQKVTGTTGAEITGTACGLRADESAWVFDQDLYDQKYYLVYDPDIGPRAATSQDGKFAILDQPIGDPGDSEKPYSIVAVLASAQCKTSVMAKRPDTEGNYAFQPLPAGCQVIDQVQILESQP